MSWKVEVIADSTGKWCSNSLRFATEAGARNYGNDLWSRWTAVTHYQIVECTDPVTTDSETVRKFDAPWIKGNLVIGPNGKFIFPEEPWWDQPYFTGH